MGSLDGPRSSEVEGCSGVDGYLKSFRNQLGELGKRGSFRV